MPDDEFSSNLALLDRGMMDDLRCRPIDLGRVASKAANTPGGLPRDPLDEQLCRSSLRALLLTGSVKDLPEADRSRPEVQTRLDAHAAEVDFAVHGMSHRLAHMPRRSWPASRIACAATPTSPSASSNLSMMRRTSRTSRSVVACVCVASLASPCGAYATNPLR
ncbi:hypothetical protein [Nannocystis sp.]|uniref:hypothetical protein n=1 Tax=Nannocystis sp. TaxID=1962667 RepID=UPI0026013598|nr:hypothetical protein [Nannocystis sp.]MBK7823686.1 hypothetical protein [Nannocystis sp.]